jgi:hypothetical protein
VPSAEELGRGSAAPGEAGERSFWAEHLPSADLPATKALFYGGAFRQDPAATFEAQLGRIIRAIELLAERTRDR